MTKSKLLNEFLDMVGRYEQGDTHDYELLDAIVIAAGIPYSCKPLFLHHMASCVSAQFVIDFDNLKDGLPTITIPENFVVPERLDKALDKIVTVINRKLEAGEISDPHKTLS